MANSLYWYIYGSEFVLRKRVIKKLFKKNVKAYYKTEYVNVNNAGERLTKMLYSKEPFMAARIGFNEMSMMKAFDFHKKDKYAVVVKNMCDMAGFFPNEISFGEQFFDCMKTSMEQVDLLGLMDSPFENYYVNHYLKKDAIVTPLQIFDFWRLDHSWTTALLGKKVLVVHPFIESIVSQYENKRTLLFPDERMLPEFQLIPYKAIQTAGGEKDERFANWFEALEYMKKQIRQIEFDVAIIGCGAYGFPLAADIKESGRQAIHMGGVSQILFGIKGQRWTKEKDIVEKLMNDNWVWPSDSEVPVDFERIEGGPYFKPTESYRARIERSRNQ